MSIAPHPAFRWLWIEAAAAGHAMRQLGSFQNAWNSVIESTLDLPLLDSDELVQPLIAFGAFGTPIDEALARIDTERDANHRSEPATTHQLHSAAAGGDSHRDQTDRSLPFTSESTLPRTSTPKSPAATQQTKPKTFAAIAHLVESDKVGAPENSRLVGPVPHPGTVSAVEHRARSSVREVERQIRSSISNSHSQSLSNPPAITRETRTNDVRPLDRVPTASVKTAASKSNLMSSRQAPARTSLDAAARVAGKKKGEAEQVKHGDLFDKVLSAAIERVRSASQRQLSEDISSEPVSRESESVLQRDPREPQPNFPRTGLQRLAARAFQNAVAPASEEIRSQREPEFAEFAPAQSFSAKESAEFASQLSLLLRQEMARHGISLEDLEQ